MFHTWLDGTKSSKCGGDALQDGDGGFPATHHCGRSAAEHLVPGGMTKRILCDLLVLMITTLWLCFSHDDNMIWHNMTCSSTMGHTGKQFGLVKEFEDSRSRYQGCYMICKI